MNIEALKKWFHNQPIWLQKASKFLIEKGDLTDEDYEELYNCCLNKVKQNSEQSSIDIPIDQLLGNRKSNSVIRLKSIGNIKGINALAPKNPLKFGEKNLVVIYGLNRSGKSGYVRVLKHICGTTRRSRLIPDVYKNKNTTLEQKCAVEYQKGDELKRQDWEASEKPIDDLKCVDIFDSERANYYATDENEVTYEPQILLLFSELVNVCEKLSSKFKNEIDKNPSKKPNVPLEFNRTKAEKWYNKELFCDTTEEVNTHCSWTEDDQNKLSNLNTRLSEGNSKDKIKDLKKKNEHLQEIIGNTEKLLESFSDQKCIEINTLKEKYVQAKNTADVVAKKVFKSTPLEGVGSKTWKQLWKYAKEYSEQEAYKEQPFPVISDGALCVLCHQKLDENSKSRFKSFKDFVQKEVQRAVENAKTSLESIKQNLPNIPKQEILKTKMDATGVQLDNISLTTLHIELEKRKNQLISSDIQSNFIPLPSFEEWKNKVKKIIINNENKAKQYEKDAIQNNRHSLIVEQKELQARKWLAQQINPIKEEIKRLKYIEVFNSAKKLTDTTALSKKKSELSTKLITEDFVQRFNTELGKLKADKVKIEIFKSKTEKGKAFHQIRLKDASLQSEKAVDILSEGELRIVVLSAFIADVTGGKHSSPFVFDDPISSLDQDFEEAVAQRLVQLSKDRQVIIFTHRLSMLSLLEEYAKEDQIDSDTICIRKEAWGTGEPGDIPLRVKKPKKALHDLINKLPQVENILNTLGREEYEHEVQSLVGNFRIIIENVIEDVLLMGVVKRYRKQIYSKKVKDFAKIKNEDCKFIDSLMTKYSESLHSTSDDTPVSLPDPDQLKEDFKDLLDWINKFNKEKKGETK